MTNITPGQPISEADRAKIGEENAAATKDAQTQAQEQLARDQAAGIPTNPAQLTTSIADSIKKKLENDEFSVVVDDATGQHVPPRPPSTNE